MGLFHIFICDACRGCAGFTHTHTHTHTHALQHLRSVGGAEQARHPVTGEILTILDFQDIMRGVQVYLSYFSFFFIGFFFVSRSTYPCIRSVYDF